MSNSKEFNPSGPYTHCETCHAYFVKGSIGTYRGRCKECILSNKKVPKSEATVYKFAHTKTEKKR